MLILAIALDEVGDAEDDLLDVLVGRRAKVSYLGRHFLRYLVSRLGDGVDELLSAIGDLLRHDLLLFIFIAVRILFFFLQEVI